MTYLLRSPDGDLIEVSTPVMRVRLKAQGYRDAEPDFHGEADESPEGHTDDLDDDKAEPFSLADHVFIEASED